MNFQILFQPALYIMSKLSFKAKIIISISILFLLLLSPSRKIYNDYIQKSERRAKQLIGLEYLKVLNSLTQNIQKHRHYSLAFLNGDKNASNDLELEEDKFLNAMRPGLLNYDEAHLKILFQDQDFVKALSLYQVNFKDNLKANRSMQSVIDTHNIVIEKLINLAHKISQETTFTTSKDLRINYLANMIENKLLYLTEYTYRLQNASFQFKINNKKLKEYKVNLFSLYTDLHTILLNLKENELTSTLSNYAALEDQSTLLIFELEDILKIVDQNIINPQENRLNSALFHTQINSILAKEAELYSIFTETYNQTIEQLEEHLNHELLSLFTTFLTILAIALYIFIAFYQSITGNLKKLQTASELISSGQTNIKLKVDKKDEIGDALLAFNTMSKKLGENISFLDGYKTAIDNSSIVSKTDEKGVITYVNQMFCDVSGYTRKELIGRSHNIVRHPSASPKIFEDMWRTIQAKKIWKGTLKNKNKAGEAYIVNATILPILNSSGQIIEYVAVRHDITELERSKEEIKKQRTDLLTGLPNRNQLLVDLKTSVKPIIFYLNIDNFSGFNDFYGSDIGDSVIINLAETVNNLKKETYFKLYKLHADQFILLFEESYLSNKNFQTFFDGLLKKIEDKISHVNLENQNRISISISGGVATYYAHDDYQKLILYANIARKKAKRQHKKFLLFDHSMSRSEDYAQNIEWIKRIKEAIEENRITTYFQPILDNKTCKIVKYETLVRMLDKNGHPVPTWTFLEIAQKAKLYPEITKIVVNNALKTFENFPHYQFSINLTIDDILSKKITEFIYEKVKHYSNSHNIIFEITESEEVNDYKIINDFIDEVKKYGVKIAIDDFGSGYANFEHIINIDADFIKIDGTLIKNIDKDKNAKIITEAIISFSKKLGRETITEYVHNEKVYNIVKDLGADYSQGFYFGVPSPEVK